MSIDGKQFTGTVYHVRENGWLSVETNDGTVASGPSVESGHRASAEYPYCHGCGANRFGGEDHKPGCWCRCELAERVQQSASVVVVVLQNAMDRA